MWSHPVSNCCRNRRSGSLSQGWLQQSATHLLPDNLKQRPPATDDSAGLPTTPKIEEEHPLYKDAILASTPNTRPVEDIIDELVNGYGHTKADSPDAIAISGFDLTVYDPAATKSTDDRYVVYTMDIANLETNYMTLGYWMKDLPAPKDTNGDLELAVGVFATGYESFNHSSLNIDPTNGIGDLRGSAKYTGPVTGVFAHDDGHAGQFLASAELTVNFYDSASRIEAKDWNSIEGIIADFTDQQEDTIDSTWSVNLGRIQARNEGGHPVFESGPNGEVIFTGGATSTGGMADEGAWQGGFFGTDTNAFPRRRNRHLQREFRQRASRGGLRSDTVTASPKVFIHARACPRGLGLLQL